MSSPGMGHAKQKGHLEGSGEEERCRRAVGSMRRGALSSPQDGSLGPVRQHGERQGRGGFHSLCACLLISLSLTVGTGNCFYVSMPAGPLDPSTDSSGAPTDLSQPDGLPAWRTEPQPRGGSGEPRRPNCSPPSLAIKDMGIIFQTIEQLTLKLNRLKVREMGLRPRGGRKQTVLSLQAGSLDGWTTPEGMGTSGVSGSPGAWPAQGSPR